MLLYNEILHCLATDPYSFTPLVLKGPNGHIVAGDWAEGFIQAMSMRADAWSPLTENEAGIVLIPILYLGSDEDQIPPEFLSKLTDEMIAEMHTHLADAAIAIDEFWRSRRKPRMADPIHHRGAKVGRNDPCPCGSGRKFKKCCGATA